MKTNRIPLIIVPFLFLLSCSASQFGWKAKTETDDKGKEKSDLLEDFDPLSLRDDDIVITPTEKTSKTNETEKRETENRVISIDQPEPELVQGYRVQLLATGDEIQAREAKKNAIFRFSEGVYLVFEVPLYRLRIGDCKTRKEAEELREKAVRNGFRDAWVVPSKIVVKNKGQPIR